MANSPKVLKLTGPLTVDRAASLRDELSVLVGEGEGAVLDFDAAAAVDLSFVQLLYAAARAMQSKGHALAFSGRLAPEIGAMLATAGFCHRVPDRADGLSNALFDLLPAPAAARRARG